ncbi:hypothetical protein [Marinactinospora rubrisoli]|uniref:Secreted protein n=1 Tax=Marinactinospora rubrisoli TaxID=2715399 RepID=A0ABW2KPK2_9ACTN
MAGVLIVIGAVALYGVLRHALSRENKAQWKLADARKREARTTQEERINRVSGMLAAQDETWRYLTEDARREDQVSVTRYTTAIDTVWNEVSMGQLETAQIDHRLVEAEGVLTATADGMPPLLMRDARGWLRVSPDIDQEELPATLRTLVAQYCRAYNAEAVDLAARYRAALSHLEPVTRANQERELTEDVEPFQPTPVTTDYDRPSSSRTSWLGRALERVASRKDAHLDYRGSARRELDGMVEAHHKKGRA